MIEIDDLTSNGFVRRWELIDGQARCPLDAIPATDPGALAALQRNAAVRTMIGAVEAYEAAERVFLAGPPTNGEPMQIADHAWTDHGDGSSAPMIANPAYALLQRTLEDGSPEPRWTAFDAAQATYAGASDATKALAAWRMGEPAADSDGYATWQASKDAALAELAALAAIPLAVDPRFPVFDPSLVKAECGRRIYAVASDNAQKNMLAAICAGLMADADKTIFETGVVWIAQMQAASRDLIAARHMTFADNEHWPPVPPGVRDLALRY